MKTIFKYLYLDSLLQSTSLEDNILNPNWSQELIVACLNTPCWCLTVRKWTYDQPHQNSFSSKVICFTKWLFSTTEFFSETWESSLTFSFLHSLISNSNLVKSVPKRAKCLDCVYFSQLLLLLLQTTMISCLDLDK